MSLGKFYIGTSGWQYPHWRGEFYHQDLAQKDWLNFYARHFNSVEVNSTFYRSASPSTFAKWTSQVPPAFTFAIKGNRFITHIKRLKDCRESLAKFSTSLAPLVTSHRSPVTILWQLPPNLKKDIGRLETFLKLLSESGSSFRHAFEFRHPSWIDQEVLLTMIYIIGTETTAVIQDWPEWPIFEEPTGKFVYLRFHGNPILYTSGYQDKELKKWAGKIKTWLGQGKDVYAYFNNDALGFAVPNALRLRKYILS